MCTGKWHWTKTTPNLENVGAEIFELGGEVTGKIEIALDDLAVHVLLVLGVERHVARRHFEDQHAHCPPVHRLPVAAVANHLVRARTKLIYSLLHYGRK